MLAIITALAVSQAAAAPAAPVPAAPAQPCAAEEYAAFDFWLGEWDVYQNGGDAKVADSVIEKVSNGCVIRETWMPLRGGNGTSMTTLEPRSGTWHQLWVGPVPGRVFFEGGPVEGEMVLTGYWGQDNDGNPTLVRMTYSVQDDGSVRQYGQQSIDHGRNWSDSFDFIYRPHRQ